LTEKNNQITLITYTCLHSETQWQDLKTPSIVSRQCTPKNMTKINSVKTNVCIIMFFCVFLEMYFDFKLYLTLKKWKWFFTFLKNMFTLNIDKFFTFYKTLKKKNVSNCYLVIFKILFCLWFNYSYFGQKIFYFSCRHTIQ